MDLRAVRTRIGLSQSELAELLGTSVRTVQGCEQGWRNPSPAVERSALLLLMAFQHGADFGSLRCWERVHCTDAEREGCLVYRTRLGHLCWLLSGHICRGLHLHSWEDKKKLCSQCDFFHDLLPGGIPTRREPS